MGVDVCMCERVCVYVGEREREINRKRKKKRYMSCIKNSLMFI